jgi:GNAT superfamily N-acetyltransferase
MTDGSATACATPAGAIEIRRVPITHPDAVRLIDEVQAEYVARYGGPDETPIEPAMFEPPEGAFFVGYVDGRPLVSGAWRRSGAEAFGTTETAEVKRMYVAPAGRGAGHARRMLAYLEESARAAGFAAVVLETGLAQPEAIALYESSGYLPVTPFGHYRCAPTSRCYGKLLAAS